MSSVLDIESAIAKLPDDDFNVLRAWFSNHEASRLTLSREEMFDRFSKLYGALDGEDGDDLAQCCEEAGKDSAINDSYEW